MRSRIALLASAALLAVSLVALPALGAAPAQGSLEILPGQLIGSGHDAHKWYVRNGPDQPWELTYTPGWQGEGFSEQVRGQVPNLRSANAIFDDETGRVRQYDPDFTAQGNTDAFIGMLDTYREHGLLANDVNLQGGFPGYEGAANSAFNSDGSLRPAWMDRAAQVIEASAEQNMVVVLGYFYFRQDDVFANDNAVRQAVINATDWLIQHNYRNVIIEIANEYNDDDYRDIISTPQGQAELIRLAQSRFDNAGFRLAVSTSRWGDASWPDDPVADAADLALLHCNGVEPATCASRATQVRQDYPYPIVVNEDDNTDGTYTQQTLNEEKQTIDQLTANGVSYGLMINEWNQYVTCDPNPNCGTSEFDWALGPNPGANGSGAELLRNFAHGVFDHLQTVVFGTSTPPPDDGNVALNKPATASSVETENGQQGTLGAERAVDGNTSTRWGSQFSDPQWIRVDLGAPLPITRVVLRWEGAYGRAYQLQVSDDGSNWTQAFSTTTGDGGVDDVTLDATARYVRMLGTQRTTQWGYSLWEFEIYGEDDTTTPPADGDTAAERFDWGAPLPGSSDEFTYGSEAAPAVPDQAKWKLAGGGVGQCWDGHAGNGRRCDKNTRVHGGVLRMTGEAGGDTGWLGSKHNRQYGRYEARVRSTNTAASNGRQYHPLLIVWPTSEAWPQDGEYDYLENMSPGEDCAEAFIHYPHDPGNTQQEHAEETNCGAPLSQWHNVAFEWAPTHVAGFIDGQEWFRFSGGATSTRRCIQCMPLGFQTIQLDNFYGSNLTPASYEVDWYREYTAP
jgi:hypothetical protein